MRQILVQEFRSGVLQRIVRRLRARLMVSQRRCCWRAYEVYEPRQNLVAACGTKQGSVVGEDSLAELQAIFGVPDPAHFSVDVGERDVHVRI